jgi:hypothetical protein
VFAALTVLGGTIFASLRLSARSNERMRQDVHRCNANMDAVASQLGLRYAAAAPYEHPVIGRVPAFGSVRGTYRDFPCHVEVTLDGNKFGWGRMHVVLLVEPPRRFDSATRRARATFGSGAVDIHVEPQRFAVTLRGRPGRGTRFVVPGDSHQLRALLDECVDAAVKAVAS